MCGRISWKANGVIKFAEAVIFAGSGSYLVVDKEERDGEYAKKYKGHMVDQVTSGFLYCHRYITFGFDIFYVLNEKIVSAAIVGIYVVSTLIGGMIIGKLTKSKRYLWGMVLGIIYFVLLLRITLGVYRTLNGDSVSIVTSLILCAGGGMTGGMIS